MTDASAPPAPPAPRPRRRISAGRKALFAAVTLGVLLGVPEGFLRVREVVRARRKPRLPVEPCPLRQVRPIPGARVERDIVVRGVPVHQTITINSHGLRGPEVTLEKPAGVVRVACVGASTTFGLYAEDDATWPARLEQALRGRGRRVEVLNCGAPGWTSRQSLTNLELVGFKLRPDVVVVYHNHNDLLENRQARYHADSRVEDWRALEQPLTTSILEHSAIYRLLRARLRDPYTQLMEKAPALDPEGEAAFERNLRRLIRRCGEEGARVLLCTYPRAYRDTLEASRAAGVPELDEWFGSKTPLEYPAFMEGLRRYDEVIRRVGADTGAPVVDLARLIPDDVTLYASPIHHSAEGERRVAAQVEAALLERHLLDPPAR